MADFYFFMLESEKKFACSALSVFDYRHRLNRRTKCSINDHLTYTCMVPVLLITILGDTAIKPNATKCSHCKAYDHFISRCPLPKIGSDSQKTTKLAPGTEVCLNFNKKNADSGKHASENMSVWYVWVYAIYHMQQHRALP